MPLNMIACDVGGRVFHIAATIGGRVSPGDPLLVVETTDVEMVLDAPLAGEVAALLFDLGDMVPEATIVVAIGRTRRG